MSESDSNSKVLREFIEATGRYHYHIEYNQYWTNHVMHALIAQHLLGASDEHLKKVAKAHIDDGLEPTRLSEKKLIMTDDTWKNYLGKQHHFVELAEFFDHEY